MSTIIGVDPSLSSTGVTVIDTEIAINCKVIGSKPATHKTVARRYQRLWTQAAKIRDHIQAVVRHGHGTKDIALIVIEAPAYSRAESGLWERAGLWWQIVDALEPYAPVLEVTPSGLKSYVAGKGNAGKDEMLLAVSKRYPLAPITDNNTADSTGLAAIGARLLGHPIEAKPLDKKRQTAFDKVAAQATALNII